MAASAQLAVLLSASFRQNLLVNVIDDPLEAKYTARARAVVQT